MINKYFDGELNTDKLTQTEFDNEFENIILEKVNEVENYYEDIHFSNALEKIWEIISLSNKYIDKTQPWVLFKSENEKDKEKLTSVMCHLVESLRIIGILLQPALQETSNQIFKQLNIEETNWDTAKKFKFDKKIIKVINKSNPLFIRLEPNQEIEYLKNLINSK